MRVRKARCIVTRLELTQLVADSLRTQFITMDASLQIVSNLSIEQAQLLGYQELLFNEMNA